MYTTNIYINYTMSSNVKVFVRVRPQLAREQGATVVEMPADTPGTTLLCSEKGNKKYRFDDAVWSCNPLDTHYVDNVAFYRKAGPLLVDHVFQGYNVCLLAYGQTGLGKTYTMMGDSEEPGVIPQLVRDMVTQRDALVHEKINCEIRFSYVEIYNEKVKDLLQDSKACRIREHPVTGPYVENVTQATIGSYDAFRVLLDRGNAHRMTAATRMNDASSRSHAVLTFLLVQTRFDDAPQAVGDAVEEMVSNIKLVDLAGSERLAKTQVFGQADRMKEGSQINKSLSVLGRCINILANKPVLAVVPYRDSALTYLLRENLAGNSKTAMVFCVSPCDYDETHQTLNYADQVKRIKTAAKANASTMLPAPPIDWAKLRDLDKSAIETLKEQIGALTKELDELRSIHCDDNVSGLMRFLERESTRQAFEIKYLKSVVAQQKEQAQERQAQNAYLHSELRRSKAEGIRNECLQVRRDVGELARRCARETAAMDAAAKEFAIF